MRKPIIAGNWKMFKTRDEALEFIYAVNMKLPSNDLVDSVICAQAPLLRCLVKRQGDNLRIGAQNVHYEESGAFTGEVSVKLLENLNVSYVIIGHSERRQMFNESNESINKKIHTALNHDILPILCCGEDLDVREAGTTNDFISRQITSALKNVTEEQIKNVVIAYEPIWSIGTGKAATADIANETCGHIRSLIKELYSEDISESIRIQYGGSVKVDNINELMSKENIDGALIGGASLDPNSFLTLVNSVVK